MEFGDHPKILIGFAIPTASTGFANISKIDANSAAAELVSSELAEVFFPRKKKRSFLHGHEQSDIK